MAAKEPATTFAAPAVAMADELEEGVPEPVPVGVTLEVNVVPVAVEVEFTPLAPVGVKVGKVVGADVVEAEDDDKLVTRDEEALVDETEAELAELLTGTLTLLLVELELELEPAPLEAAMWNGNEYWKVEGSESRLIFKPYVASAPRLESTLQV